MTSTATTPPLPHTSPLLRTGPVPTRSRRRGGLPPRDTAALLSDYELPIPTRPALPPTPKPERVNRGGRPRRGQAAPGHGWTAVEAPLPTMRTTTDQIGGLYPLVATQGVPPVGVNRPGVSGDQFV